MKTLLLVTKLESVQEMYYSELVEVFGGYLDIQLCLHPDETALFSSDSGIARADLVLITNPYSFPKARRQMRPDAQIINLDISFQKEKIAALKRFPVGTETLVCLPFYSIAHQTVNVLYEAGVTNLNLYINYRNNQNMEGKRFDLALTGWAEAEVPKEIPQVFNLGRPKLSLPLLLDIAAKAGILDDALGERIAHYCGSISTPTNYISYFYDTSTVATLQFKALMECIDYAIVIYDESGTVINFNQNFLRLFGLSSGLTGQKLTKLHLEHDLDRLIHDKRECQNRLCALKELGRSVTVSKEKINKGDRDRSIYILLIKDVTELTNLETSLRRQIAKRGHVAKHTFVDIKGNSPSITRCIDKARRIAGIDKPTLIIGESGTGKELFAQSIHNASGRANFPFVAMNCAAIPTTLLESELFGYDEGAFTGAKRGGKEGLFQMAHRGTLFLDEIGELPLLTQAKLLRVLEEKEIMRVGSGELISVDVRIIAATNRDLKALVKDGAFRLDLYYRLNTLIVNVPPLRERRSDIPYLINAFLQNEGLEHNTFAPDVWRFLMDHDWEGNIRELRNCIEYMANIGDGRLTAEDLPDYILEDYERSRRIRTLHQPQAQGPSDLDPGLVEQILGLLKGKPMGRYNMVHVLEKQGVHITEYQARSYLQQLSRAGYLRCGRGRAGCCLTERGDVLLSQLGSWRGPAR